MTNRKNHSLRNARCQRNLTINQLAEAVKIGASTVWRAEHGYVISADSRQRLCAYFGMSSQELGFAPSSVQSDKPTPETNVLPVSTELAGKEPVMTPAAPQFISAPINLDSLLFQSGHLSPEQQLSSWLTVGSGSLGSFFEAGWTLESLLDALRVVLQGTQGMPGSIRTSLLKASSSAVMQSIDQPTGEHISPEERYRLQQSLTNSIDDGWHLFHKAPPAQVLVVAQTLLTMVQQMHSYLSPDIRPTMYAGIYNLMGASLLFQGRYDAARRAHEKAQIAGLEAGDTWSIAQSLNWQAIVSQLCGRFQDAIFSIEAALRLLGQREDIPSVRLRAHLLADWAYNAAHLPGHTRLQEQLEASAILIKPLELDEEFDYLQWQQVAGYCFLLRGKHSEAIHLLELALSQLPPSWLIRHLLTLLPLAESYARAGERDASLETGIRITSLLEQINACMFNLRFGEYYQTLQSAFPHDPRIRSFLSQSQQQFLLPLQTGFNEFTSQTI